MFKKISIIKISPTKIVAAKVNIRSKKIVKRFEYPLDLKQLINVVKQIKKDLKTKTVRILVSDKLSYVTFLKVPYELTGEKLRQHIFSEIIEQIPEKLDETSWDFKVLKIKDKSFKTVVIFVPVKNVFNPFFKALDEAGFEIEAVEPEVVALKRNEDPLVGVALKKDIQGKDESVLNLVLSKQILSSVKEAKSKGLKLLFFLIFVFIVLIGLSFLVYQYAPNPTQEQKELEKTPTEKPTEVVSEEKLYDYSIEVLNGSGIAGEATKVLDLLRENGFSNIEAANADSYDYEQTIILTKEGVLEETLNEVKNSLRDYEIKLNTLEDDAQVDIRVIIGSLKK